VPPDDAKFVPCNDDDDDEDSSDEEEEVKEEEKGDDATTAASKATTATTTTVPKDAEETSTMAWIPSAVTAAQCRTLVGELMFSQEDFQRLANGNSQNSSHNAQNSQQGDKEEEPMMLGRREMLVMAREQLSFELDEDKFRALAKQKQQQQQQQQEQASVVSHQTTSMSPDSPNSQEAQKEQGLAGDEAAAVHGEVEVERLQQLHQQRSDAEAAAMNLRSKLFAIEQAKAAAAAAEDYALCQRLKSEGEHLKHAMAETEHRLRVMAMQQQQGSSFSSSTTPPGSPLSSHRSTAGGSVGGGWGLGEGAMVIRSTAELAEVFLELLFDREKFVTTPMNR
jgi:hypothetical protein